MPFMLDLMDLPRKEEIIKVIKEATQQTDPEQLRKQIEQELQRDLKVRELDLREREVAAREKLLAAQQVQVGVQAAYSAMQGGAQVAQMPMIAPIADEIMKGAGYQAPNPGGDDPNFPTADQTAAMNIKSPYIQGKGRRAQLHPVLLPKLARRQRCGRTPARPIRLYRRRLVPGCRESRLRALATTWLSGCTPLELDRAAKPGDTSSIEARKRRDTAHS